MHIKKLYLQRGSTLLLSLALLSFQLMVRGDSNPGGGSGITVVSDTAIENTAFSLSADQKSGEIILLDKRTGVSWYSNPVDRETQNDVKGIDKMQMNSQLIVDYLVNNKGTKQATSCASSANKNGIKVTAGPDGLKITYRFVAEKFTIPVLFTLDENGMRARVLNDEIEETGSNQITLISLLPYFGAGGVKDNGYFLVPDGSGALIRFNNGKRSSYQQEIYDTDGLMNTKTSKTTVQKAMMPVFGIQRNDYGMLSVISSGATACRLFAYASGMNGNYNYIYPQFTYRQSAVVNMMSKTWYPVDVTFVSPLAATEDFEVCYFPLLKKNGGYSDMAKTYRSLLFSGQETAGVEQGSVPLYLDLYGSALVQDNILGFSITVNRALTDFEQANALLTTLINQDVRNISIRYKGINSSGLENIRVPTNFKVASSLGGNKGFSRFLGFASEHGVTVYPEADFVFLKKATFSFLKQYSHRRIVQ